MIDDPRTMVAGALVSLLALACGSESSKEPGASGGTASGGKSGSGNGATGGSASGGDGGSSAASGVGGESGGAGNGGSGAGGSGAGGGATTGGGGTLCDELGWCEITDTHLADVCPADSGGYEFSFHCKNVIAAWSGGIADTQRERLILWGGGHGDYYGNELYSLDLKSLEMQRLNEPSPINPPGSPNCPAALSDGLPNSRHSYAGLVHIAHADRMFAFGGSLGCGTGSTASDTWTLELSTLAWERMDPTNGGKPSGLPLAAVADYEPASKKVYLLDRHDLWSYTYETNTYQHLAEAQLPLYTNGVIDPKRKLFVIMGPDSAGASNMFAIPLSGSHAMQDWTASSNGCENLMGADGDYPGLAYDPVLDKVVGWTNGANTDRIFLFDPDTRTCEEKWFGGGPPSEPNTRGVFGRFRYFPSLGVFAVVNHWEQNAYTLRLTP